MNLEIPLPIDEMLLDLREALEAFQDNPCDDTFNQIQSQTFRIETFCEAELLNEED